MALATSFRLIHFAQHFERPAPPLHRYKVATACAEWRGNNLRVTFRFGQHQRERRMVGAIAADEALDTLLFVGVPDTFDLLNRVLVASHRELMQSVKFCAIETE